MPKRVIISSRVVNLCTFPSPSFSSGKNIILGRLEGIGTSARGVLSLLAEKTVCLERRPVLGVRIKAAFKPRLPMWGNSSPSVLNGVRTGKKSWRKILSVCTSSA